IIDGKEIPGGSKIEDYVKPENIESMTVLKDKTATDKYGDKGKKGVIEIKTKKLVKSAVPVTANAIFTWKEKDDISKTRVKDKSDVIEDGKMTSDTIYIAKQHLIVNGGSVSIKGKIMVADGALSFQHGFTKMPLVMYNGKEVTDNDSFKVAKAGYNLHLLDEVQAIVKYGTKAKYGALEIDRL
ncbi:MAG TPA: hypothetical protein VK645_14090, partial [Chitinophagaceae bacterium]|nr:hypothetical protein [Chitinophagaceae bacterium]